MRGYVRILALLTLAGTALIAIALLAPPRDPQSLPPRRGPSLGDVVGWGYQLQRVDPASIPDSVDLLVTDYSRDGSGLGALSAADVELLRQRPDGRPRIVLAYLSIGEAEAYRSYWRRHWRVSPPAWLGPENKDWKGNFAVRYWEPDWQRLILDPAPSLVTRVLSYWLPGYSPAPYLDRIVAAGFDGVFLDKVDGYEDWATERPQAAAEMMRFVSSIADHARMRRPGFLVVQQNAEELLSDAQYAEKIDAIAKEDLFFGISGDEKANETDDVEAARALLASFAAAGKPVFVVEYVNDPEVRRNLAIQSEIAGYKLLFAVRELNLPPEPLQPIPSAPAPDAAPDATEIR